MSIGEARIKFNTPTSSVQYIFDDSQISDIRLTWHYEVSLIYIFYMQHKLKRFRGERIEPGVMDIQICYPKTKVPQEYPKRRYRS